MTRAPDGRPGCDYCAERLRVNVGLLEENRQLKAALSEHPDKWSFDVLVAVGRALLDEVYPEDIFPSEGDAGDPGPRLVRAVRDCLEARDAA